MIAPFLVGIIISVAMYVVSTGISLALAYLNKPKTRKSIFGSSTYHENGMINSIQPGTPKNIVYGEHRIPPSIINKYSYAVSDEHGDNNHTKTEILCSLGEETTGVWGVRVNDQSVHSAYKNGKGLRMWWAPGGRTNQLIYESRNTKQGSLTGAVSPGYNVTIDFDYDGGNNKHPFQGDANNEDSPTVSATRPGYVLIYKDGTKGHWEMVRYEGIQANGGQWRLTGCRVTKSHANGSTIQQLWQLAYKDDSTTPLTIMPPFGKNITEQQDLNGGSGTVIDYDESWCPAVTTNNKVRSFAVTVGWEKGLYGIDKESGYKKKSCRYQIRWQKVGGSWATTYTWTPKTLHDTTDSGLKLIIEKNAKYAYVVNADGTYYADFVENFATQGLKLKQDAGLKKYRRWKLVFDGKKQGEDYTWTLPKETENSIIIDSSEKDGEQQYENPATGQLEYKYRCKIKFDTSKEKYDGPSVKSTSPKDFKITYDRGDAENLFEGIANPSNAVTAAYRLTHHLPDKEPLDYAKYEIQVKKLDTDIDNQEDGQNEMRWLTLQEMDNDALEYPYESLLGFRLKMNEKVNTTIENITCMTQGKAVTDVQNASNIWAASTAMSVGQFRRPTVWDNTLYRVRSVTGNAQTSSSEPTWLDIGLITDGNVTWEIANRFSDNPLDICADIIMSKRYGRGKYLELTNDRITAFYDKFKTEAAFADEAITENGTQRKRFSLNFNLDFRGPLIDLLQSIGSTFRGKFYFDGEIPICYIDRKKTPTAMFCMGNIVEDSYKPEALSLADNINRLQAQFLDKDKNYTQNTDQADIISIDSSWTVNKLMDKSIALYGLIKKWYVRKILNYMLRFAWYTRNSTSFQTTLDGISCDIGDIFYCHDDTMNLTAQSGRIITVGSNYIDMDKAFTFVVATTYKALLRKDNGQPHSELTVDLAATGTGAQTRVCFTSSISSVSANSIYILGLGANYYMTFRCVQRGFRGNVIEIGALEYNEEVYRVYKNDSSDPAWTGDSDETVNEKDTALPTGIVPPEIPQMVLVESRRNFGEVEVQIRPPYGSLEWSHADIYYQEEGGSDWTYVGQTRGEPKRIGGLRIGKEYDFKAVSISPFGVANNNETTATITLTGSTDIFKPNPISGIQLIGNKGSVTNVYGSDFEFKWNKDSKLSGDDSTSNYGKHAGLSNIYENLSYRIAVYFSDIPASVKHAGVSVKDKVVHEEIVTENHYRFRLAQNIEASKDLWKDYSTHASYSTYYGKPNRVCRFVIQAINGYGNVSVESEVTLTNPAPDMNDSTGANTSPVLKALKSGVRVKWIHPYQEYDISHFMVQYAENSGFTTNLKKVRVSSAINVNSTDDELDSTQYKVDIDGLDPKKTYYVRVRPHDTYGAGTFSGTSSIVPGVSDDDADDDIVKPGTITGLGFNVLTNGNLRGYWTLLSDVDISEYIYDWRAVNDTTAVTPPTLTEIENEVTAGGKACYGIVSSVMLKGSSEATTKNQFIVQNPQVDYKYFFRVRAKNTSRKLGDWQESWTTHSTAITGMSGDNLPAKWAMYKFLGTVTAVDATHVLVSITGGSGSTGLKKKTQAGSTNIALNDLSSTAFTGTRFIAYTGSATLSIKTEAQMDADSSFVGIAKIVEAPSGKCKVLLMLSAEHFSISAYEGGFNKLSAITADLGSITAGDLTLDHDGGSFIVMKDNSGVKRIFLSTQSGSKPVLRISKASQDASTSLTPDNCLFTSEDDSGNAIETFKVVNKGSASAAFVACDGVGGNPAPLAAGTVLEQIVTLSNYGSSSNLSVFGFTLYGTAPNDWLRVMPFTLYTNGNSFTEFEIAYSPSNTSIICVRRIWNTAAAGTYNPGAITITVNWSLRADVLS